MKKLLDTKIQTINIFYLKIEVVIIYLKFKYNKNWEQY